MVVKSIRIRTARLLRRVRKRLLWRRDLKPEGSVGVEELGHRGYVGTAELWDEVGRRQYDFLVDQGLRPEDVVIDVGCGALRAGVHVIPFLEPGNYLGLDKEPELIRRGLDEELDAAIRSEREPEFAVSDRFDFDQFTKQPTYGMAFSVFTHLTAKDIERCLAGLRRIAAPGCRFFASYFEAEKPHANPPKSHSHAGFLYTREQMQQMGAVTGWDGRYVGDWGNPTDSGQVVYEFVASSSGE